jgi:hypothetical protein
MIAERFYRAAWYAAAGWCLLASARMVSGYLDEGWYSPFLVPTSGFYWPLGHTAVLSILFVFAAGPLVLLTVGHWAATGVWRFGWKG